jgi:hypothetical protein
MGMSFATRAAVAEFVARAARLNYRNADPEGFNFLRDGQDEPFNAPLPAFHLAAHGVD